MIAASLGGAAEFNFSLLAQITNMTLNSSSACSECFSDSIGSASGMQSDLVKNFYSDIRWGWSFLYVR